MKNVLVLMIAILACIPLGCGQGYHWSKKHPAYNKAPYGELTVAGTQTAFILTRTAWFANRLGISNDSMQIKAQAFCQQFLQKELAGGYTKLTILPETSISKFPEESQKIDERIFMKGRLPEQGVVVLDSAGNIPQQILLLHEIIIGTDLKRENFFDYNLIHNEAEEKRAVENITAIVSYTLWDNEKQRSLFSAIDEIQHPVKVLTMADMETLIQKVVVQIRSNLYLGAK